MGYKPNTLCCHFCIYIYLNERRGGVHLGWVVLNRGLALKLWPYPGRGLYYSYVGSILLEGFIEVSHRG